MAPGINSYIRFCKLARRPFSPVAEGAVKLWSDTFNPGKTFKMYLAHLQKAFPTLNLPTDWLTSSVLTIAAGLANAQVRSFQFPNLIRCDDLVQPLRRAPLRGEFGQVAYMAYIFSLRVPPETLQMAHAFDNDPIAEYEKRDTRAPSASGRTTTTPSSSLNSLSQKRPQRTHNQATLYLQRAR